MKDSTLKVVGLVVGALILISFLPELLAKGAGRDGQGAGAGAANFLTGLLGGIGNAFADLFAGSGSVQLPDGSYAYSGKDAADRTYDPSYYQLPLSSPADYAPALVAIDQWYRNNPNPDPTDPSSWKTIYADDPGGH